MTTHPTTSPAPALRCLCCGQTMTPVTGGWVCPSGTTSGPVSR